MKRASYRDAIAWLAENEQGDGNPDLIVCALLARVWGLA